MKAVILAGGRGTRISEESDVRPKPMIEIGYRPMLWHIMKLYSQVGIHDFIICLGYRGYLIKEYFANYSLHMSDLTVDLANNKFEVHTASVEPWRVTLIDTGDDTMTGGRLKRIGRYLDDGPFCLTYGDGVSDLDIQAVIALHRASGKILTLTAVQPAGRFGGLQLSDGTVTQFREKPRGDSGWVNGGFFVASTRLLDYIDGDQTILEAEPMERLVGEGQVGAYQHSGFWYSMDTMRDKEYLEELWATGRAPWKTWERPGGAT